MLYNGYVWCMNKKGKPQQKLQCLFPMYITPIQSIQAYMLTTQNNIRIRKPQCYVVCFWQNGKLQEKAQQYVLEEILLLLQTTTVCTLQRVLYTTVIPDLFITNQILLARTQEIGKSLFFILFRFCNSLLPKYIAKTIDQPLKLTLNDLYVFVKIFDM